MNRRARLYVGSPDFIDANLENRAGRGRRLSWREFFKLRPDRKPANDNAKAEKS
ncbi:hypothetical protein GCM10011499_16390 [Pelagibacterium lentulum]|uniref:Uncharacterized protein n=1 Tax=Pelagibacterium lentulum TaxID=2029865 RepID=A0A916RB33_9HYPH|nr:hypothetical protein GCM10011499_16390 [Pelagibacterium lentulum]